MFIEFLSLLFSAADDFAVISMAALIVIWVVILACYIGRQASLRQRARKLATEAPHRAENVISIASCQS